MRILGFDIGERRIGLAVSNLEETMAVPAGFLEVQNLEQAAKDLVEMIREENCKEVVVGLPYRMDGSEGGMAEKVKGFVRKLKELAPDVDFRLWDERLTSFDAQSLLVKAELKHSGKKKRGRVDAVAASLILQSYLDSRTTDGNLVRKAGLGF